MPLSWSFATWCWEFALDFELRTVAEHHEPAELSSAPLQAASLQEREPAFEFTHPFLGFSHPFRIIQPPDMRFSMETAMHVKNTPFSSSNPSF